MPVFNDLWLFSVSIFSACSLEGWRIFQSVASEVSPGSLDGSRFAFPTLSVALGAAPGTCDRQLRVLTSVQISFLEKKIPRISWDPQKPSAAPSTSPHFGASP